MVDERLRHRAYTRETATTRPTCATGPGRPTRAGPSVRVLVVNAGSSSLKLRLLGPGDELEAERDLRARRHARRSRRRSPSLPAPDAVGHRVVHGGARFREAVLVDDGVVAALGELTDLAPLHQPAALAGMAAVGRALPDVPAVACFDTAFHATLPAAAATYALPREWRERFGLRRFGFHGLSHAYASRRAPRRGARGELPSRRRRVAGAVRDGVCVDTTMGFTPMEGLVMATRAGQRRSRARAVAAAPRAGRRRPRAGPRSRGRGARPGRRRRHARGPRARRR